MVSNFLQSMRAKPAGLALIASLTLALSACGGGGGEPGATRIKPTMSIAIVDAAGAPATAITTAPGALVRVTVKDAAGQGVPNAVVLFAAGSSSASPILFSPSATALTDGAGAATVGIRSSGIAPSGAYTITADTNVAGQAAAVFIGVTVNTP